MIKIYIFADSYKHFRGAIWEYQKRLGKAVQVIELKPIQHTPPQQIITKETSILKEKLQKETGYKIILSPNGKQVSTLALDTLIENQKNTGNDIVFAIWWAYGLDYVDIDDAVDIQISLGTMTLPHSLALTVLLEQLYRCREIQRGSRYHK